MKQVTFNGTTYSRTKIRNNILRTWNTTTASDRHDWYQEAHDWCRSICKRSSYTLEQTIGVVAALSPLLSWEKNKEYAEHAILEVCEPSALPCMGTSCRKAEAIMSVLTTEEVLAILKGPKTTAFYMNIMCPRASDHITIDRHAIGIAFGQRLTNDKISVTPKQYRFIQDCYAWTASGIGVSPLLLQSATWVAWRKA